MKKLITTILCSLMLVFAACDKENGKASLEAPEMVDTEDGKNDMISYFTDIVGEFKYYGETIYGDFLPNGYLGFRFTGKGGEVIAIEITAMTQRRDPVLYLYPPKETDDFWGEIWRTPIAMNDDIDYPDNVNSAIGNFTLPEDGEYLIVAAEYYGGNGSFSLTLLCEGGGCETEPLVCGTLAGLTCPDGYWCKYEDDYTNAAGKCIPAGMCEVSIDCDAQGGLIHPMCLGIWTCNFDSGETYGVCEYRCDLWPPNPCEANGGHCGHFLDECGEGFESVAGEPWGCPGGRSGVCCLPIETATYACQADDDCTLARADCCGCHAGGVSVAVNKNHVDRVEPDPEMCRNTMCRMVNICFQRPACVNNICTLVDL